MFERVEQLIGLNNLVKLKNTKILIVGIGGVGGTALETLVRSGVGHITIIDHDKFILSNLNRQIISGLNSVDKYKVDIAKERYLNISNNLNLTTHNIFLNKENINLLDGYDYIIDACDSIDTKIEIIKYTSKNNIKLISCMGMGNRLDPSKVYITKLSKTENDPLSKKLRYELRKENINLNIPVVASKELPIKSNVITSMMLVPSTAGILLTHYIINDIIKE